MRTVFMIPTSFGVDLDTRKGTDGRMERGRFEGRETDEPGISSYTMHASITQHRGTTSILHFFSLQVRLTNHESA